ncbi:hypothetical protein CPLU01_01710 [Colletotrichum plurivorum]|uniref:Uncharacterized protein n=1 Tax=Colletotrichum plurivorum TaxID=2175906 RepID=A0A8H6KYM5_9PEZI|nr:hypothetical protein CPLU01_01710 [Colletotrichum plurivorum]
MPCLTMPPACILQGLIRFLQSRPQRPGQVREPPFEISKGDDGGPDNLGAIRLRFGRLPTTLVGRDSTLFRGAPRRSILRSKGCVAVQVRV